MNEIDDIFQTESDPKIQEDRYIELVYSLTSVDVNDIEIEEIYDHLDKFSNESSATAVATFLASKNNDMTTAFLSEMYFQFSFYDTTIFTVKDALSERRVNLSAKVFKAKWLDKYDNPIKSMGTYEEVKTKYCTDQSIAFLKSLSGVKKITIDKGDIKDFNVFTEFSELEKLTLKECDISNIEFLNKLTKYLPGLVSLDLSNNAIEDLSPVGSLSELEDLTLNYNKITSISSLATLRNLDYLSLNHNSIEDLTSLVQCSSLSILDITHNKIRDVSVIVKMGGIQGASCLSLNFNLIEDFSCLAELSFYKDMKSKLTGNPGYRQDVDQFA